MPSRFANGCHQAASKDHDPRQLRSDDTCEEALMELSLQFGMDMEREDSTHDADLDLDWLLHGVSQRIGLLYNAGRGNCSLSKCLQYLDSPFLR
jgi:hypothetical protein